jgi:SAM-dependent methyltransferase
MPIYHSKLFPESALAHQLLDGLVGLEVGGAYHNAFGLDTLNVDYTADMTTVFKLQEVNLCGEAMPVDIVAPGDALPVEDKSVDFVISSHVIEHFFDPIKAIKEWLRVSRRYVFIICPLPTALESDREKEITPLQELIDRHAGKIPAPEVDTHEHYTRWGPQDFANMCMAYGWEICAVEPIDRKVGNGFTIVIDVQKTESAAIAAKRIVVGYYTPEAYEAGVKIHPQKYVENLGCRVLKYEMFGISDTAAMLVDRLPDPLPKFITIAKPNFKFTDEL